MLTTIYGVSGSLNSYQLESNFHGNGQAKNHKCVYSIWESPVHPRTGKFLLPWSGISAYNGREYH